MKSLFTLMFIDSNIIWDFLGKASNLTGLGTFIVSIIIWVIVKQQQRKLRKLMQQLLPMKNYKLLHADFEKIKTTKPAALCISLLRSGSIKELVKDYLTANQLKVNIFEEIIMDGLNGKEDIERYIQLLREMRRGPLANATELRLFIGGPVQAGTLAGAVFDNWIPVLLYHKGDITYEYWGPLLKN